VTAGKNMDGFMDNKFFKKLKLKLKITNKSIKTKVKNPKL